MSLEWQARSGSLAWTNPVSWWWGLLTLVSGVNIAVWFVLYRELPLQPAGGASGIGAMLEALHGAALPNPEFEDKIATFRLTLFNTPLQRRRDRREDIIFLLRERGELSTADIAAHLKLSTIAVRKRLAVLRKEGNVAATEAKPKSKNVRYRLAK